MRQLIALIRAIHVRNTTKSYYEMAFHAKLNNAEMLPLEDILGVESVTKAFDDQTDTTMDNIAQKLLAERKRLAGV